jgi:hypothetical protein
MTSDTRLGSALIAFHLLAVVLAALPNPAERREIEAPPRVSDDAVSARLAPALDQAAILLTDLSDAILDVTRPIRAVTQPYADALVPQHWIMFSHPWTDDHYVRMDHYVQSAGAARPHRRVREIALPAQGEDRARLRHAFQDKATLSAFEAHHSDPETDRDRIIARSSLEALVRHRRASLRRDGRVGSDDHVQRTEIWMGRAAIPPPGERVDAQVLRARLDLLRGYREGERDGSAPSERPRPMALEREADITWQLAYVQP